MLTRCSRPAGTIGDVRACPLARGPATIAFCSSAPAAGSREQGGCWVGQGGRRRRLVFTVRRQLLAFAPGCLIPRGECASPPHHRLARCRRAHGRVAHLQEGGGGSHATVGLAAGHGYVVPVLGALALLVSWHRGGRPDLEQPAARCHVTIRRPASRAPRSAQFRRAYRAAMSAVLVGESSRAAFSAVHVRSRRPRAMQFEAEIMWGCAHRAVRRRARDCSKSTYKSAPFRVRVAVFYTRPGLLPSTRNARRRVRGIQLGGSAASVRAQLRYPEVGPSGRAAKRPRSGFRVRVTRANNYDIKGRIAVGRGLLGYSATGRGGGRRDHSIR